MIKYKGKKYYNSEEMYNLFGNYDYNKYKDRFYSIQMILFQKDKVDKYFKIKRQKDELYRNFNLDIITNPVHKEMAIDRMNNKLTLDEIGAKHNMSRQNVHLILRKYRNK
jgi:hypothetical protein